MVPKAVAAQYWHLPWSQVVAAAERHDDGLEIRAPKWTPHRQEGPRVESYRGVDGVVDDARFQKDRAAWDEEQNVCFLYEAESGGWPKNKTLLFQQNW